MWSGRTSGIPPTEVPTTYKPQAAASTMAIQNASVSEVLRNFVLEWGRNELIQLARPDHLDARMETMVRASVLVQLLGPSPAIRKLTRGCLRQMAGMTSMRRSIPLRYTKRQSTIRWSDLHFPGIQGYHVVWIDPSMAFGMTWTLEGSRAALRTVFSFGSVRDANDPADIR